jgi:dipicolinate synthase subunit B
VDKLLKIGFALTGSFCTFEDIKPVVRALVEAGHDVTPIFSEYAYATDTRFGPAKKHVADLEEITGKHALHSITQAEPIGPNKLFDVIVIAPCTGNTLAKLCYGITDTSVTMAAKAHLRNQRPLVIAVSTNDALSNSAKNLGALLNSRNIYFVPLRQDNPEKKPRSVVADFSRIPEAISEAVQGRQLQPILL